jgi:hypothetical protein
MDAQVLEEILENADPAKKGKEIEIKLIARLRRHLGNPKFTALGERLEKIKDRHEQGFLTSLEFLKEMLELAKEVVEAEKGVDPVEERDRAKEALTELFNEAKNSNTHIIVERIVTDIDDIGEENPLSRVAANHPGGAPHPEGIAPNPPQIQAPHRPGAIRQGVRLHPAVLLSRGCTRVSPSRLLGNARSGQ